MQELVETWCGLLVVRFAMRRCAVRLGREVVSLEIRRVSNRRVGMGVREDGLVVFVEGSVPGDVVHAEVTRRKKRFAVADLVAVTSPSPDRAVPACVHFGACGGCQYQHANLAAQRLWKRGHVVDSVTLMAPLRVYDPEDHEVQLRIVAPEGAIGRIASAGDGRLPLGSVRRFSWNTTTGARLLSA